MSPEPISLTLWIVIASTITVVYIITLLLMREKKTARTPTTHYPRESSHLHTVNLEAANLEVEESIIKPAKKTRDGMGEDSLKESLPKKVLVAEAEDKAKQEDRDVSEKILEGDEDLEDFFEEPEIEVISEEDKDTELKGFAESAEELRRELYKLKKLLESGR